MRTIKKSETGTYQTNRALLVKEIGAEFVNRFNEFDTELSNFKLDQQKWNLRNLKEFHVINNPETAFYKCNITAKIIVYFDVSVIKSGDNETITINLINIGTEEELGLKNRPKFSSKVSN